MTGEDVYVVSWSYETFVQDMTPEEAAELAVSVFLDASDPAASEKGKVLMSVNRWDGHRDIPVGDFEINARRE